MPRHHILFDPALNGARMLLQLRALWTESESLFQHTPDSHLVAVAPVIFFAGGAWREALAAQGLHPQALVCLQSLEETGALAAHLRQFIYRQQDGRTVYFRFWDARVLDRCLARWQTTQASDFLGKVQVVETYPSTPEAGGQRHWLREGHLRCESISGAHGVLKTTPEAIATLAQPLPSVPPSTSETHFKPKRTFLA